MGPDLLAQALAETGAVAGRGVTETHEAGLRRRNTKARRIAPRALTSLTGRPVAYTDSKRGMDHGQPVARLAAWSHPATVPGALVGDSDADPSHVYHPGRVPPSGWNGNGDAAAPAVTRID